MNVSITPELERKIEERLSTGTYTSASELVREALRLFFDYDEARRREISSIARRIDEGLAQIDRGEGIDGDEAYRRSLARLKRRGGTDR